MNRSSIIIFLAVSIGYNYQIIISGHYENQVIKWFDAIRSGHLSLVQEFAQKVEINSRDYFNMSEYTALLTAVTAKHEHIVKFLLTIPGIDVNSKNNFGTTALQIASGTIPNIKIVHMLLAVPSIDINAQDNRGNTALILAAQENQAHIIKLLLHNTNTAVNTNIQDNYGDTALFKAIEEGHNDCARLLLEVPDIDINIQNINGHTALLKAAFHGNEYIIKLLLQVPKLNLMAQDKLGHTATMIAQLNKRNNIVQLIQHKIAELILLVSDAISNKNFEKCKLLIAQIGADIVIDDAGNTLLDKAFVANCPEIIEYILVHAKDPRQLLARFPFEFINPTTPIFKYIMDLAYSKNIVTKKRKYSELLDAVCAHCKKTSCVGRCAFCKAVYYCSAECQKADWLTHKNNCKKTKN